MPPNSMPDYNANVLTRAAVLLGGVAALAQRLNVRAEDLLAWIGNEATAPEKVLAKASAIIKAYEIDATGTRLLKLDAIKTKKLRSS
jgi:hypothetical protein